MWEPVFYFFYPPTHSSSSSSKPCPNNVEVNYINFCSSFQFILGQLLGQIALLHINPYYHFHPRFFLAYLVSMIGHQPTWRTFSQWCPYWYALNTSKPSHSSPPLTIPYNQMILNRTSYHCILLVKLFDYYHFFHFLLRGWTYCHHLSSFWI